MRAGRETSLGFTRVRVGVSVSGLHYGFGVVEHLGFLRVVLPRVLRQYSTRELSLPRFHVPCTFPYQLVCADALVTIITRHNWS